MGHRSSSDSLATYFGDRVVERDPASVAGWGRITSDMVRARFALLTLSISDVTVVEGAQGAPSPYHKP